MTMKRILLLFLLFCGGYVHAQELDSVRIYYRQGHREVDVLFRDNRAELERFIRILREEYGANRLESVVVRSWSSPEGVNHLNEVLSDRRADSLKTYLVRHAEIPDNLVCIHGEGIAWDMLRRMVAASDMLYKKEVLHILDHTPVWVFDKAGRVVDGRKKQSWTCAAVCRTPTCWRTSSQIYAPAFRWSATGNPNRLYKSFPKKSRK